MTTRKNCCFISKKEIEELLEGIDSKISIQNLSTWLKSKTNQEFTITEMAHIKMKNMFHSY
ncbi:MAG: hypothetical protein H6743_02435 [Rickettsiaceae bacterium]|nr:hypothetical protein [Rickettsiaceae bacterium]